jgi:acyl-CoA dehydrogenase
MAYSLTPDQSALDQAIERICADFGDDYWLARDTDGVFPEEFVTAIAAGSASPCPKPMAAPVLALPMRP